MKIYQMTGSILLALALGACASAPTNNTAVVNQTANQPVNQAKAANENSAPDAAISLNTPTETLKTFAEATKRKDAEVIRRTLSKSTMKVIEASAKEQKVSVNEMLTKAEDPQGKDLPATRNEKIKGDRATLEVQDDVTGEFDEMPFVKEDGEWKIALDEFLLKMRQKMMDEMKKSAPKGLAPKSDTKSNTAP